MKNKFAQQSFGMSFGMIFSIFLIVIFIVFAGFAINFFLDLGDTVNVGDFYNDFQDEIDNAWQSQSSSKIFEIDLPKKIELVCFADLNRDITGSREVYREIEIYSFDDVNLFLYPPSNAEGLERKKMEHINLSEIVKTQNPKCFENGRKVTIKKDFYDKSVIVE